MGIFFKRNIHQHLFFIHIMKTGGTSLRQMLISDLGEKAVYPNDSELKVMPNHWYSPSALTASLAGGLRDHKVLIGHHPFSLREKLGGKYLPVTFLREPLGRSLSMIGHWKRNSPGYAHISYEELLDDQDFVRAFILNYQTKVFSMGAGEVNAFQNTAREDLKNAVGNIAHLAFVGIYEYFRQSCRLFDERFKTTIARNILHSNANPFGAPVSENLRAKIMPLIELDLVLYQEAVSRFKLDAAKYGIVL